MTVVSAPELQNINQITTSEGQQHGNRGVEGKDHLAATTIPVRGFQGPD